MPAACDHVMRPSRALQITSALVIAFASLATQRSILVIPKHYRGFAETDIFRCLWDGHLQCSLQHWSGQLHPPDRHGIVPHGIIPALEWRPEEHPLVLEECSKVRRRWAGRFDIWSGCGRADSFCKPVVSAALTNK